ncbi:hypothetical protein ACVW1A_004543 [Bradyrhizobium sp. LB1.3]
MTIGAAVIVLLVSVLSGNLLSARRVEIDLLKRGGAGLEAREHLQHDMVLIKRGEHRGDDTLTEGIIERVIHARG